jgi:hypothetical protein
VIEWRAVDVGSSERFEIELVEQPAKRSRFRHPREPSPTPTIPSAPSPSIGPIARQASDDVVFTRSPPPEDPDGSRERNRLVVTALAVGAVALFLGWSLGRAGGGDGDGDAAARTGGTTATTEAEPDQSSATPVATGDTLPEASLPSTTRPRPTTTVTLPPEWVESQVKIDPRLAGQSDRVVAVGDDGRLIELDVATGTLRTLERSHPNGNSPMPPVAGDDWVVVRFATGRAPQLFRDGDTVGRPLDSLDPWSLLWDPATGSYWEQRWDDQGQQIRELVERSVDGRPTGRTIDTRGLWAGRVDFTGGLIIGDGSLGAYRVTPDGSERLVDGYVLAVGLDHLLVYACAENFDSCAASVVDRASGASRLVPVDDDLAFDLVTSGGWWGAPTTPEVNADGTAVIVSLPDRNGQPATSILDLVTGELTPVPRDTGSAAQSVAYPSGAWSADGRFAYLVSGDSIAAFDHANRQIFLVVMGDAATGVRSLTLRPA